MRVLILEQEKTIRKSLSNLMEGYKNFEVFSAYSYKEGSSLFQMISFDMVLCGDRLPDGNGLDILKDWIKENPKLISILMTVQSDEWMRQEAINAGIRGYLVKPFDLKQLEEAMGLQSHSELGFEDSKPGPPHDISFNKERR